MDDFDYFVFEPPSAYGSERMSNKEFAVQMRKRTESAAVQLVNLMEKVSRGPSMNVIRHQILKSGTSVSANYRAACRARSHKEWYAKMCIVVEECDETIFWLELLLESDLKIEEATIKVIGKEYQELLQIFSKSRANYKSKK